MMFYIIKDKNLNGAEADNLRTKIDFMFLSIVSKSFFQRKFDPIILSFHFIVSHFE